MQIPSTASVRNSYAAFPTGIALIAAEVDGQNEALLANSFATVSLEPPLVSIAFTLTSTTWPKLRQAEELGITVLAEPNAALVPRLASPAVNRLDGIALDQPRGRARTLRGAAATFVVRPHQYIPAGDHELVLFQVLEHRRDDHVAPLTYYNRRVNTVHS